MGRQSSLLLLALLTWGCATPVPEPGCIPNLCSLLDGRLCEPCDGYDEAEVAADPEFRLCPDAGRMRVCCDDGGCRRLDRVPNCEGTLAVCHQWVGVNTFNDAGEWLGEGTCYQVAWLAGHP